VGHLQQSGSSFCTSQQPRAPRSVTAHSGTWPSYMVSSPPKLLCIGRTGACADNTFAIANPRSSTQSISSLLHYYNYNQTSDHEYLDSINRTLTLKNTDTKMRSKTLPLECNCQPVSQQCTAHGNGQAALCPCTHVAPLKKFDFLAIMTAISNVGASSQTDTAPRGYRTINWSLMHPYVLSGIPPLLPTSSCEPRRCTAP
jgi:hypothetical protein